MILSVIIPVFNTEKQLLQHCVESLLAPTALGDDVEFLFIDDGSTAPHVAEMLRAVSADDSRVKYFYQQNQGQSAARRHGLQKAQGDYVMFSDSDDYWIEGALDYVIDRAKAEQADFMMFGISSERLVHDGGKINKMLIPEEKHILMGELIGDSFRQFRAEHIGLHVGHCTAKLYRRSLIVEHKVGFDPELLYNEDTFFNLCVLRVTDQVWIDNRVVYHYVYNQESISNQVSTRSIRNTPIILNKLETFVTKYYPDDKQFYHAIGLMALSCVRWAKGAYFCHPANNKTIRVLKSEMNSYLSTPPLCRWIKVLKMSDAIDRQSLKNILLLKLSMYWIFLFTQR